MKITLIKWGVLFFALSVAFIGCELPDEYENGVPAHGPFQPVGELDTAFGNNGVGAVSVSDPLATGSSVSAMAIASNGKIYITGQYQQNSQYDMYIACFTNKGILCSDFSIDGTSDGYDIFAGSANLSDNGRGIIVHSNGGIYVVGTKDATTDASSMAVWKYKADGTLDNTFGGGNGYISASGGKKRGGTAIVEGAGGRIYVAGYVTNTDNDFSLTSYNADGSALQVLGETDYDSSSDFGHTVANPNNDYVNYIGFDENNKIILGGKVDGVGTSFDAAVWRFLSVDAKDTTFGTNGMVSFNNIAGGNSFDNFYDAHIDKTNSKIYLTGGSTGQELDMFIMRLNANGSLDTTFNLTGKVVHNDAAGGNSDDAGAGITLDSAGNILVTGESKTGIGSEEQLVVWRYKADGSLDTSFSHDGWLTYGAGIQGSGNKIRIDSNYGIIVGGRYNNLNPAVWRFK